MTPPPSREPARVTDAEAEEWRETVRDELSDPESTYEGMIENMVELICNAVRADRAGDQKRIVKLEERLSDRSWLLHGALKHESLWDSCPERCCVAARALLEAQDAD